MGIFIALAQLWQDWFGPYTRAERERLRERLRQLH
jgi:hypothetical protein